MNKTSLATHTARHQRMLDFQETIKPFTPTIEEMMEVWCLSKSGAYSELGQLVNFFLVIKRNGRFYAIAGKIEGNA